MRGGGGVTYYVPSRVWTAFNHIRVMNVGGKLDGLLRHLDDYCVSFMVVPNKKCMKTLVIHLK